MRRRLPRWQRKGTGAAPNKSVPPNYNAQLAAKTFCQRLTRDAGAKTLRLLLRRRFASLSTRSRLVRSHSADGVASVHDLLLARSLSPPSRVAIRLAAEPGTGHIATISFWKNAVLLVGGAVAGSVLGLWAGARVAHRGGRMFGNFSLEIGFEFGA